MIFVESGKTFVHRQVFPGRTSQIQFYTSEKRTVSSDMCFLQGGIIFLFGIRQQRCNLAVRIFVEIIGSHADQQNSLGSIMHGNRRIARSDSSTFRQKDTDTGCIAKAFHLERIDSIGQLPLHQQVIAVGRHQIMFGTIHAEGEVQGPVGIGSQTDHAQIIGKGSENLTAVIHFPLFKRGSRNRVIQIQFTPVGRDRVCRILIIIIQYEVAQQLITTIRDICSLSLSASFTLADEGVVHQLLRLIIAAFKKKTAYLCQRIISLRIIGILFASRPHGDFIQDNVFRFDTSVRHQSETPVT